MKIAINSLVLDNKKAGVGNYAFNLIKCLSNTFLKDQIDVYVQKDIKGFDCENNLLNYINVKSFNNSFERIIFEQLYMPIKYKKGRYDVVHLLDYQSPFFAMGQKYILTIHDLSYFLYHDIFTKAQRFYKKLNTSTGVKKSSAIITVSESTKNDIIKMFPDINEEKINVIPLAVNKKVLGKEISKKEIDAVKQRYGINSEYILFVGTLEPRKNLVTLIKSFKRISYYNNQIKLVIVGKKGWLYKDILKKVEDKNIKEKVVFTDYVPEAQLSAIYKGAKLFVFPSIYEGFGLPVLEAMTVGCPVITSYISSLPEVVGNAGILINPEDEMQIADNILMLLNDDNKREELIIKGKKRAEKFSWEKTVELTLQVYEKVGCDKIEKNSYST
jgi:glycosyltransferase involved in cell wall biosynthesis